MSGETLATVAFLLSFLQIMRAVRIFLAQFACLLFTAANGKIKVDKKNTKACRSINFLRNIIEEGSVQ